MIAGMIAITIMIMMAGMIAMIVIMIADIIGGLTAESWDW